MDFTCQDIRYANHIIRAYVKDAVDVPSDGTIKVRQMKDGLEFYATTKCSACGATVVFPNWPVRVKAANGLFKIPAPEWAELTEFEHDHQMELFCSDDGADYCAACLDGAEEPVQL